MVKELESPTALVTGLQHLDDVPMPEARIVINDNFAYLDAKPSGSGGGLADPGQNGLVKRIALNVTAMAQAGTDYQAALGFTPENVTNKDTDALLAANSDAKYASQRAIKSYVDSGLAGSQPALGYTPENVVNKDVDATLAANSDTRYPSQKAVKAYAVPNTRQVLAGAGMSGGGFLNADRTFAADVVSVFGRTGAVTLSTADIVTAGGVPASRLISTDATLAGGGDLSADRTLSVAPDSVVEKVRISAAGALAGTRRELNFINGANVTCSIADNPGANRVDISIASTGGAGGMVDPTNTKGDLIVKPTGAAPTRLGVGADAFALTADAAQTLGVKWSAVANTVFGRSGTVVAQAGDYTAAQVGAVPTARQVSAGSGLGGGGPLTGDVTLTANVTSVFGRTGAVTLTAADVSGAGGVPNTRLVIAGSGLTGGGALTADVTLVAKAMGASGPVSHSAGIVPDPGVTAGTTKFLREDATWVVPPAAPQTPWTSDINGSGFNLSNAGTISGGRLTIKADSTVDTGLADVTLNSRTGVNRWSFGKGHEPETGSNVGSRFLMARYADDGSFIDVPFGIHRDGAGQFVHYTPVGMGGKEVPAFPLDVTGDVNITGAYRVNGAPIPTGSGPAASAYMTGTSPTFLMGVATPVPFNATEFDSSGGSMHSNTVNPTRLLAPSAGYYLLIANHQFAAGTGTVAKFTVNGADVIGSQTQAVITAFVAITATAVVHLNANDYVEYVITAVTADALVFTFTDAPRAAPRLQLIRLF